MGRQSSLLQAEAATYGRHMSHQALPRLRFRDDISYPLPMPANAGPDGVTDGVTDGTDGAVGIPWGERRGWLPLGASLGQTQGRVLSGLSSGPPTG